MEKTSILTENDAIIQRLTQIPALQSFDRSDLENMLKVSEIRRYKTGEYILEEGKTDGWVYYLVSGKLKIVKRGKNLVILQRSGDVFGEMSAVGAYEATASVQVVEDAVCLAVDISDMDQAPSQNKFAFRYIIYREFAEVLAGRLKATTEELIRTREKLERLETAYKLAVKTAELAEAQNAIARLKRNPDQ